MRKNEHKRTDSPDKSRHVDRIYNGSFEEYEDPADYTPLPDELKGRVVA